MVSFSFSIVVPPRFNHSKILIFLAKENNIWDFIRYKVENLFYFILGHFIL